VTAITAQSQVIALTLSSPKAKAKASNSYIARLTGKPDQPCSIIGSGSSINQSLQKVLIQRHGQHCT